MIKFQSTLPREERPVSPIFDLQTSHFNPRSHERSDSCEMFSSPCTFYFNPRSHERSDTPIAIPTTPAQFQSTLPREERLSNVDFKSIPYISIHAPTRGATKNIVRLGTVQSVFQSTLPREERLTDIQDLFINYIFQSTLPREERLKGFEDLCNLISISIHAPTRGATKKFLADVMSCIISIHAPTRGATAILHKKFVYFYTIPTINI